jgi:hypothetical protein
VLEAGGVIRDEECLRPFATHEGNQPEFARTEVVNTQEHVLDGAGGPFRFHDDIVGRRDGNHLKAGVTKTLVKRLGDRRAGLLHQDRNGSNWLHVRDFLTGRAASTAIYLLWPISPSASRWRFGVACGYSGCDSFHWRAAGQKGTRNLFPEGPGGCYAEKVPGTFLPDGATPAIIHGHGALLGSGPEMP